MEAVERKHRWRSLLVALAVMAATFVLAACGGDDTIGGKADNSDVPVAEGGTPSGELTISNWPGYIDLGKNGTIPEFEKKFGVKVDYIEDVNDNNSFFGKMRPLLEQGESGGRSIFVVTDWMAKQMYDFGYLQEINHEDIPNVDANLLPSLENPPHDPERAYSIPWQTGMTGIWVNTKLAPDIRSVNDLFDPKYKGKVTFLSELRDSVPLVLKADGIEPEDATSEDWLAAIEKLRDAAESGQIRRFTGNDYTEDLTSGNVVASIGWSGDAYLIGEPAAEWRMPAEGCILWSDNVVIPVGAPNTAAALAFTNFVYDPQVQADIAAFVNYVTPVDGVKEVLAQRDPALANNELIFPSEEFTAECDNQPDPPGSAEEQDEVNQAFQEVVTG